jgi:N-acetylmuramoyl-L-alanine amidase
MGKREKILQYFMLVILFALAFVLPAMAGKNRVSREAAENVASKESALAQAVPGEEDAAVTGSDTTGGNKGAENSSASENNGTSKNSSGTDGTANGETLGTIVLDAGHGGSDPGMVGESGISEKVLNLIYAQKLEVLLQQAGYRVVQTRETEAGLYDADETNKKAQDMQRRCAIIEQEQPLLTVSIHQNSYPQDTSVCGPQVFYYEHSTEGEHLADCIQTCMNEQLEVARPRTQKGNASYYILKRSASTTVIVECGFLTTPAEEAMLQDETYQDRLVQAVCDGILQYLEEKQTSA